MMHSVEIYELDGTQAQLEQALQQIAGLDAEIFPGNIWGIDSYRRSTVNTYDYLTAAMDGSSLAGFALLRCFDDAELIRIAVDTRFRRQGIGEQLLSDLLREVRKRDIHDIFLEVRSGNEAAIGLYTKAGFISAGVRKGYYSNPTEDAIIMRYTW